MAQDSDPSGRKVALLLDCDDRMEAALAEAGYHVERGATGFVNGTRKLPIAPYNADVIVYDPHGSPSFLYHGRERTPRGRFAEPSHPKCWGGHDPKPFRAILSAEDIPAGAEGEGQPRYTAFDEERIRDVTPNVRLSDASRAVAAGVPLICFLNRSLLARIDALAYLDWAVPDLCVQPTNDPVELCRADPPDVWGDFFGSVRSPLIATMAVGRWLDRRRSADARWVLHNRVYHAHALMLWEGAGAIFVLPEFKDNAVAVVRLATEIWPVLRQRRQALPTSETAQSGPSLRDCPCGKGKWEHKLLQYELATKLGVTDARIRQVNGTLVGAGARAGRLYAVCTCCGVDFYRKEFALGVRSSGTRA